MVTSKGKGDFRGWHDSFLHLFVLRQHRLSCLDVVRRMT